MSCNVNRSELVEIYENIEESVCGGLFILIGQFERETMMRFCVSLSASIYYLVSKRAGFS